MQTVSSGFGDKVSKGSRRIGFGVLMAWMRTTATGVKFFTINQSRIGGPDILKSGGSFVSFHDKYQYDDTSEFVESLSVSRKMGQYPYGVITSEADIQLDNTTKKFLPNFDTTIGSGILPNRPIKISVGIEDEYFKLFTGFTKQPDVQLNNRTVNIHAFDVFDYFFSQKSSISGAFINAPFQNVVASGLYEMGFSDSQFILDKSLQDPIGYLPTYDRTWGEIFKEGVEAEQGLMFADENGLTRFWNRQHFTTQSGVVKFNLSYDSVEDISWQNTPIINDVIVRAKPRAVQVRQKIWENNTSIEILSGQDKDVFVDFSDENGPLPVTSVNLPKYITTASGRQSYYATNTEADGSGLANDSFVSLIDVYNFGSTYRMTFRNSYTSSMFITQLGVYATPAKVTQVIEERYTDATSIENFGRNPSNGNVPLVIENDLIQSAATANTLAYTLANEYKSPGKRYLLPLAVGSNPALQIGDYGQVLINETGELKDVYITGITNVLQKNGEYEQVLEVEERTLKSYFTINVSRIGGTDSIAP